jgi:hypothetical protein
MNMSTHNKFHSQKDVKLQVRKERFLPIGFLIVMDFQNEAISIAITMGLFSFFSALKQCTWL